MALLLVIEDEEVLARNVARYFERLGHEVEVAHDGASGLALARELSPDVVLVDFQMPDMDGLEVIRALQRMDGDMRIVMVTGHASVSLAIDAMKAGSMDLLTKPVPLATLSAVVDRVLAEAGTQRALAYYQKKQADQSSLDALVGQSAPMQALRQMVLTIAGTEPADGSPVPPVLVLGETGAGKELVARACHFAGPRASAPFVEINCAALPAHLLEGELFGHEKGAFTDAQARKIGLIESADGGTLFLDEIGELDLSLQAKLLRVLENLRVRRLGALQDRQVNVRIVAATNRDLDAMIAEGRFRSDLLYRLRVFQVTIPPLRDRGQDVLLLAERFMDLFRSRYAKGPRRLDDAARQALLAHPWPGNVRELRNLMERVILLSQQERVGLDDIGPLARAASVARVAAPAAVSGPAAGEGPAPATGLEALERQHLLQALHQTGWNVTQAARLLDISRDTLRYRIERHGLVKGASSG